MRAIFSLVYKEIRSLLSNFIHQFIAVTITTTRTIMKFPFNNDFRIP